MPYYKIVQEIKRILETEQLTDKHLWYLGFEIMKGRALLNYIKSVKEYSNERKIL